MDEDPAFYKKFSELIQQAIDDFNARHISDLDYFNKICAFRDAVVYKKHDDVPETISRNDEACAYYGVIKPCFMEHQAKEIECASAETALAILRIIENHQKVDFWIDDDAQNVVRCAIDDFLYDEVKGKYNIDLSVPQMDEIIEKTMQIAKSRRHSS